MKPFSLDLRGIPESTLEGYLASLGGERQPDGAYAGPGWLARITGLPDFTLGALPFCQYRVEFSGEPEAVRAAWKRFEMKIMRPGG